MMIIWGLSSGKMNQQHTQKKKKKKTRNKKGVGT